MRLPAFLSPSTVFPSRPAGVPVAPGWLPVVGHVPSLIRDLPGFLRGCDRTGPLCWLDVARGPRQLVSTREEAFTVFRNRETSSKNLANAGGALLGRSLLVFDGSPHRRMRGAMGAPFTPRGLNAASAGALIREVVEPRVAGWLRRDEVALTEETREFAVDVIFRMMGIPSSELSSWRHQFEELMMLGMPLDWDLPGLPRRRGMTAKRWIDARLERFVAQARGRAADADLVAAMVHGRDEHGGGLDHEELLDNLRILVFAGHETTASIMAWMTLELAAQPSAWHRAVDEALAADGPPTTAEELARFPFMEAVFRETLRLHPPVPLDSRETETEIELFGAKIPPGLVAGDHELLAAVAVAVDGDRRGLDAAAGVELPAERAGAGVEDVDGLVAQCGHQLGGAVAAAVGGVQQLERAVAVEVVGDDRAAAAGEAGAAPQLCPIGQAQAHEVAGIADLRGDQLERGRRRVHGPRGPPLCRRRRRCSTRGGPGRRSSTTGRSTRGRRSCRRGRPCRSGGTTPTGPVRAAGATGARGACLTGGGPAAPGPCRRRA